MKRSIVTKNLGTIVVKSILVDVKRPFNRIYSKYFNTNSTTFYNIIRKTVVPPNLIDVDCIKTKLLFLFFMLYLILFKQIPILKIKLKQHVCE